MKFIYFVQAHDALKHWSQLIQSKFAIDNLRLTAQSTADTKGIISAIRSFTFKFDHQTQLLGKIVLKEIELQRDLTIMQERIAHLQVGSKSFFPPYMRMCVCTAIQTYVWMHAIGSRKQPRVAGNLVMGSPLIAMLSPGSMAVTPHSSEIKQARGKTTMTKKGPMQLLQAPVGCSSKKDTTGELVNLTSV